MNPKPNTKPELMPCFECDSGRMQHIHQDYATCHPKLGTITIPRVSMLRCDHCGDTVIGHEGNTQIDAYPDNPINAAT